MLWNNPADCASFVGAKADPKAFCEAKIGGTQTFSERIATMSGNDDY